MKAYFFLNLVAPLLTRATAAAIGALTGTGIAITPEKTSRVADVHLRARTGAAASVKLGKPSTETGTKSPAAPKKKMDKILSHHSTTHRTKCTSECCVFRLRERQWIPPDTTVVVLPTTAGCVPVPVEGQYNLLTTQCSGWFETCTLWPQRDCTGAHRQPIDVHGDLGTWWGAYYWVRAISCTRNESFAP